MDCLERLELSQVQMDSKEHTVVTKQNNNKNEFSYFFIFFLIRVTLDVLFCLLVRRIF